MNKGDYLLAFLLSLIVVSWWYLGYRFLLMVTRFNFGALFFSVLFFLLFANVLEEVFQ